MKITLASMRKDLHRLTADELEALRLAVVAMQAERARRAEAHAKHRAARRR